MALFTPQILVRSDLYGRLGFGTNAKVSCVTPSDDQNPPSSFSGTAATAATTSNLGIRRYVMSGMLCRESMEYGWSSIVC